MVSFGCVISLANNNDTDQVLNIFLGGNNETSSPSERGSLHGCCHKASSTINRDRISAKVSSNLLYSGRLMFMYH